jgi:hypothetical protein
MKSRQLNIVLLLMAVLAIGGLNARAQSGNRGGIRFMGCMNITGLTDNQKSEINHLRNQHRKEMNDLHIAWRQTADYTGKDAHRAEVRKKVENHRNAVRNLLNDDQKVVFDNRQGRGGSCVAGMNSRVNGNGFMFRRNGGHPGRYGRGWSVNN